MRPPTNTLSQKAISCESCSLNAVCLPSGLTVDELARLEKSIDKTIKIKKKDAVFRTSQPSDGVYAVKSGAIKTSIANSDGQEQVLEFHLPGDVLGFDAFNSGVHSCDAIALEDTLICKIPEETIDDLCVTLPGLRHELKHQLGKEISHHQNLLLSLGQQQTDERLATFLLEISNHYQSRGFSNREFVLPMSRQDLSNYLGMAVETLSRIISRMTDDNIIKVERRIVIITDMDKLEALAHSSCKKSST